MKKSTDPVEREKAHPTVSDSSGAEEKQPIVSVRAGNVWTDFIREPDEQEEADARPRQNGSVPLFDDMTGIRQWE